MKEFLASQVFDNRVDAWLIIFAIVVSAFLLRRFAGRYFTKLLSLLFRRVGWKVDPVVFEELVLGPSISFLFLLATYLALSSLHFPKALRIPVYRINAQVILDSLATSLVVLSFFRMLLRGVDYIAREMGKRADLTPDRTTHQLVVFSRDFLKVLLLIIGTLTMLRVAFDQDITKILTGLSLAGAAIALAARESLENLIASFIIFFDKPFSIGDVLKTPHVTGTVEKVGLRSTRIRTADSTYVTLPNKQMVDAMVDNLSRRIHRRVELRLEASLRTEAVRIEALVASLRQLLQGLPCREPQVYLADISADAYVIVCEYQVDPIPLDAFHRLRNDINLAVMQQVGSAGVLMAGVDKEKR
ncbi:MAG: mechanosensitive ion channel [Bacteroidetes bacterium]|nr:mechanosensitive ion channel [Bacteroidota bacterium]